MKNGILCSSVFILAALVAACEPSNVRSSSRDKNESLVKDPSTINAELCKVYLKSRDYNRAKFKCDKALRQNRRNPKAHKWTAILHQSLGQDKLARRHFIKAIELAPEEASTHNNFGVFLLHKKEYGRAERHFMLAARNPLYQARDLAYSNAGICMLGAKKIKKAETYFREALRINAVFSPALYNMAYLSYRNGRYTSANGFLQRWQERNRWNAAALWLGIRIAWKLRREGRAASLGLLLRNRYPDSVQARQYQKKERSGRRAGY